MQHREELETLNGRINVVVTLILVAFSILAFGFWNHQILQAPYYRQLAERNRIRDIALAAPRGTILDREKRVIADSRPSYNLVLNREQSSRRPEETIALIAQGIEASEKQLLDRLQRKIDEFEFKPIVLAEDLSIEDIAFLSARTYELPEVFLEFEPRRRYQGGAFAAHVIGYLGEVSSAELADEKFANRKSGDIVGKAGLERQYDEFLRGQTGLRRVIVNNYGREMGTLGELKPVEGNSLVTTLDLDLQEAAELAIGDRSGAAVAINPLSGEVLAMVSRPAYDPTLFSDGIHQEEWEALLSDPRKPLQNRSIQNRFSPGSVFKVFLAAAGLEEQVLTNEDAMFCPGSASFYGESFDCWKKGGHGRVALHGALVHSCNVFFYNVGDRLGINTIASYVSMMGLGRKTGIDLPSENAGIVPSEDWKERVFRTSWYPGETISVSIGQGPVSVTPLQLTWAVGGLVVGGQLNQPFLVDRTLEADLESNLPKLKRENYQVQASTVDIVRNALWGVVHERGTGSRARVSGIEVAGKTGTAQVVRKQLYDSEQKELEDHAWFVGFAPFENPEIVVGVFVENGGHGGASAAPIAKSVMQTYFDKKSLSPYTANEDGVVAQMHEVDR